jgi:RNA polymerase sigma factor (sigma-70 family)
VTRPPDSDLIQRCRAGDENAWVQLTGRYADLVFAIARRRGLSATSAGDVVQEVFLALLGSIGRLRRTDRIVSWVIRTAERESWRQKRVMRQARLREEKAAQPERAPQRMPAGELAALEDEQAVREAYGAIGERCRRLLDALFMTERKRPYAEIAEELGLRVGSIGPTRRRCLEELRHALEGAGFLPPDEDR